MQPNDLPAAIDAIGAEHLRDWMQRVESMVRNLHDEHVPAGGEQSAELDVAPLLAAIHAKIGDRPFTLRDVFDEVRRNPVNVGAVARALMELCGQVDEAACRSLGQRLPKACGRLVGDLVLQAVGRDPKAGRVFVVEYRPRQVPKQAVGTTLDVKTGAGDDARASS